MQETLNNGLLVSVDWLSFTFDTFSMPDDVIRFLGIDVQMFHEMDKGANGYRKMKKCVEYNISVLYEGNDNMGIHVTVSGRGVAFLLDSYRETLAVDTPFGKGYSITPDETVLSHFLTALHDNGHLTRLDIAVDDVGGCYYLVDDINKRLQQRKIVSKFRTYRQTFEKTFDNECKGYTIYFGSRSSEIMLRIYDKKLEQNKNLQPEDSGYINYEWVRWELELTGQRACDVSRLLSTGKALGSIAVGVLCNYVRIIQLTDSNRSRCKNERKWDNFVSGIESLRLFLKRTSKTLDEKYRWLEHQVAPTMATLLLASGGDKDMFNNMAFRNKERMSMSDKLLVESLFKFFDNGMYQSEHKETQEEYIQRMQNLLGEHHGK